MSVMWTNSLVSATWATGKRGWSRKSTTGSCHHHSTCLDGGPCSATLRKASSSRRNKLPNLAPQIRVAFSKALFEGEERQVHLRIAGLEDRIYIDLGTDQ